VKTVCVFASSSPRTPERYLELAAEFGRHCAALGWRLVNGAGGTGCMGALNDACLASGGTVRGIILKTFHDDGLGHDSLHDLVIADSMRERKRLLGVDVDAYVVLPGGPGTWEEFWEVAVERQIGSHDRPLVLLDPDGFYRGFLDQAERAEAEGLLYGAVDELFAVATSVDQAFQLCAAGQRGARSAGA